MRKKELTEAAKQKRISHLQKVIQTNYDQDNWYGYSAKRKLLTIACQVELISLGAGRFEPTYICPA